MRDVRVVFDHVHIISEDPQSAASWYVDKLGGEIIAFIEAPDGVSIELLQRKG
jgi:hypothetical protein